jgi:transposase
MAVNGLVKVYFADGVHLIYGYQDGYFWCKERISVPSAYGRKRANLLGFMNAVTYETERVMGDLYLDSDCVCEGLEKVRNNNPNDMLYIILDNAAYQKCEKVKLKAQELNINLIYLPPYSPNLNLIERLWKFLRKNVLAGNYYESFELFNSSIKAFIDTLHIEYTDQLSSLLSFNFELLDSVA